MCQTFVADQATGRPFTTVRPITGTRSALSVWAIVWTPCPSRAIANIRRTTAARSGSRTSLPPSHRTQPGSLRVTSRVDASRCFRPHAARPRSDLMADSECPRDSSTMANMRDWTFTGRRNSITTGASWTITTPLFTIDRNSSVASPASSRLSRSRFSTNRYEPGCTRPDLMWSTNRARA